MAPGLLSYGVQMSANDGCLIWGEGSEGPWCLGAVTPEPPVPPLQGRFA